MYKLIARVIRILPPALRVLKQKLVPNAVLVAGPYSGELGWELMEWCGYIRKLSLNYKQTIVISYAGHACLYDGLKFYAHSKTLKDSGHHYGHARDEEISEVIKECAEEFKLTSFDWIHPKHLNRLTKLFIGRQLFWRPFKNCRTNCTYDVAFHFRNMLRDDSKNYPPMLARELVEKCKLVGLRVCCIGHPSFAYWPGNCDDLRSDELSITLEAMKSVKIVAGGSSAPMHLASLCGLPIVVWCPKNIIERYLYRWNPHRVPVFIVSDKTFQPSPENVLLEIHKAVSAGRKRLCEN